MMPTLPALALSLDTNWLFAVGYAPLPQIKAGDDDEQCMLKDLDRGAEAHPNVLEASRSFLRECAR